MVLPGGAFRNGRSISIKWFNVQVEPPPPARPLRHVVPEKILAALIDFQRSQPAGPADKETACKAVASKLHTSERAVQAVFRDQLPDEWRNPRNRPRSLHNKSST
jgi:hypothetical protein